MKEVCDKTEQLNSALAAVRADQQLNILSHTLFTFSYSLLVYNGFEEEVEDCRDGE
jgi:hypothetical protein